MHSWLQGPLSFCALSFCVIPDGMPPIRLPELGRLRIPAARCARRKGKKMFYGQSSRTGSDTAEGHPGGPVYEVTLTRWDQKGGISASTANHRPKSQAGGCVEGTGRLLLP